MSPTQIQSMQLCAQELSLVWMRLDTLGLQFEVEGARALAQQVREAMAHVAAAQFTVGEMEKIV